MKHLHRRKAICTALSLIIAAPVVAQEIVEVQPLVPAPTPEARGPVNETPRYWFVELGSPPTADGTPLSTVRAEKSAFRANARKAGLQFTERYAYDTLFNGFALAIAPSALAKLSRVEGVKAIYPVAAVPRPELTPVAEPELFTALAMTGADIAQSSLGLSGAGVKVGVIDSGVDYNHPDLGGCFGPGCRVATGYDFVGDAYDFGSDNPIVTPDQDPDDCMGHGTHVAGIVGANGGVKGVAPGVSFGAYRVFGCEGSTSNDIMIAAMERALADGMQVVNMSIGSAFEWPQSPDAMAATRLVNKGVVVVASIGNSGRAGLYAAGSPGLGEKVIGVASFDNTHVHQPVFAITPDAKTIGYGNATGAPPAPVSGSFSMVATGTTTTVDDACSALPAGSLSGKVALIRRGTCSFHDKAIHAQNADALGVVVYNNTTSVLNVTVEGTPKVTVPVVSITADDGALIASRLASGPVTMTWTSDTASFANVTENQISSFSSYGLSPDLALKPDIGAPGGFIYSTVPLELGGYASYSGTSMSSPHVAGAAALLLQAKPNTPSQAVRSILQNSAEPRLWGGNPSLGFLDNVNRQGAGMLRIDQAVLATTSVSPAKLSLGESEAGPATRTLTLKNNGTANRSYALSFVNALSNGANTHTPSFTTSDATVNFNGLASITIPAQGSADVVVTIKPPSGPALGLYGGYIVFTPEDDSPIYRVPFAGFIGDYQAKTVLTPGDDGFPWLTKFDAGTYFNKPGGATYSMVGNDIPYVLVHLDHQPRLLRMDVQDAKMGKAWHRALQMEYFQRNESTGFFAFDWDGVTTAGGKTYIVPNGQYVLRLSVLKALGDATNPAHWETWTSPVITIARP